MYKKIIKRLLSVKKNENAIEKDLIKEIDPIEEKFLRAVNVLENEYALKKSMKENACVDKEGNPIAWYTYSSIEYIKQLDFSDKRVFEFGSGNSSLFWADRVREITSVEENEEWYESRLASKKENMKLLYEENDEKYSNSIMNEEGDFDVIIVDGKVRDKCCQSALKKIKGNGLIILDNTDWCLKIEEIGRAVEILKKADLIQVDFCGPGPINDYTWATSFFFTRNFDFKSKNGSIQPSNIIGGIHQCK